MVKRKRDRSKYLAGKREKGECLYCPRANDRLPLTCCSECEPKRAEREREYQLKLKIETFNAYGGCVCACCAEAEIGFLTIDHINNDGYLEEASGNGLYLKLRRLGFPGGLQVLCYNCNCGRARNGGICPHEQGGRSSFLSGLPPIQDFSGQQFCTPEDGHQQSPGDCRESRTEGVGTT